MFPDFNNAKINGKPVTEVIKDENWLKNDFVTTVAQRGTAVLKARGAGSAASAANAAIDSVKSIATPTKAGDWHSVSVVSGWQLWNREGYHLFIPDSQHRPDLGNRART